VIVKLLLPLNGKYLGTEHSQHNRLVTASRAHFQNFIVGNDFQQLGLVGHRIGL